MTPAETGLCECGAIGKWELRFGGRKAARIICTACKREYTPDGQPVPASP